MEHLKDRLVGAIGARARERVGHLAVELARAQSAQKEEILNALDYHRWLAEAADDCVPGR